MSKAMGVRVLAAILVIAAVGGCATGSKGPTDEEMIRGTIENIKAAVLAADVEKTMATLSEDFYHPEVGDKAAIRDLAEQGFDMIDTSTAEVDLEDMVITIEGETATAYPIVASADMGSVTVSLTLKKEDGAWLITTGDAEGV